MGRRFWTFGLARPIDDRTDRTEVALTMPGMVVGTPEYMAPEQVQGETVDARTDLFAVGGLMYAMLAGRSPFSHDSAIKVLHAVLYEQPPALSGSPAIVAVDRVIRRALSKHPDQRYSSAEEMAREVRSALLLGDTGESPTVRRMTRLIVLPFRILRADPDTDFLAFSLPDAITASLSGLESLVVRSSMAAAKFSTESLDLKAIAAEADVDVVLVGNLLRAGTQLRVTTQLVEAPGGTVLWTNTSQVTLGDLFQLQDDVCRRIVESLSLPLSTRERKALGRDVPASAKAYEFYLRANQLSADSASWLTARDLYLQCLDADPRFAPAWARIGRVHRVLGKYGVEDMAASFARADAALKRALELNPDLSIAHKLSAQLEMDSGHAQEAMIRLLGRAETRTSDPEVFAALVPACRYCGLLDASIAAHELAHRLDPHILTGAGHTYWMAGQYERAVAANVDSSDPVKGMVLSLMGRREEAIAALKAEEQRFKAPMLRAYSSLVRAIVEDNRPDFEQALIQLDATPMIDPEALYYAGRSMARVGEYGEAIRRLKASVERGFFCLGAYLNDPWLDSIRGNPEFVQILRTVESRHRDARAAFLNARGDRVLGLVS